jgi:hypothetical protein
LGFFLQIGVDICHPLLREVFSFLFVETLPQKFGIQGCLIPEPPLGQPAFTLLVENQTIEKHAYSSKIFEAAGSYTAAGLSGVTTESIGSDPHCNVTIIPEEKDRKNCRLGIADNVRGILTGGVG